MEHIMKYTNKKPFAKGYNEMVSATANPEMMGMEFGVVAMTAGDKMNFAYLQEVVYDLLGGQVTLVWEGHCETVERADCFHEGAILLHVPQNVAVAIECLSDNAEIAVCRTENNRSFESRLMRPDDCLCPNEERGAGQMNECSTRMVRTFFDRSNCPQTNFYVGEVVHFPGKWSSYPPHTHVEPELYFYKFLPENGYGLAEFGDEAYKIRNNDLTGMPENVTHSQVVAPGYAEYYLWCIRLQDDKNIMTLTVPEYAWVTAADAKYFPND
jgi:5-deoxy-glucuronate isomerase